MTGRQPGELVNDEPSSEPPTRHPTAKPACSPLRDDSAWHRTTMATQRPGIFAELYVLIVTKQRARAPLQLVADRRHGTCALCVEK